MNSTQDVKKAIKILLVEDEPAHAVLVKVALSNAATTRLAFDIEVADSISKVIERLQDAVFDVVLLDLGLPDSQGFETVSRVYDTSPDTPIVVLTGLLDEEVGVQAMQKGAQDYLVKGDFTPDILIRTIRYAIERQKEINRRKRVEAALKKAHDELEKRKALLEAQSELRTILTNAIPLLLMGAPPEKANTFILKMCDNIEEVLWQKYLAEAEVVDLNTTGGVICKIMNDLGGAFEIKSVVDKECILKGSACPWGTQAQRNHVLCMLCKGIFSRLASKIFENVAVNLDKTIGNRDDCCIILIHVY